MKSTLPQALLLLTSLFGLAACGGSDSDDSSYPQAYIQFYNGSANSAYTYIELDDDSLGGADYGDSTSVYSSDSGDKELELYRLDSNSQRQNLYTETLQLSTTEKALVMVSGDYQAAEVVVHKIERKDDYEEEFDLYFTSMLSNNQGYDLYMAEAGVPFADAYLVATGNYQALTHGENWQTDDDNNYWQQGEYVFYITRSGEQELVFQSEAVDMQYAAEYVAVLRQGNSGIESNLALDFVYNSSTVQSYQDINASAQYRVYNSLSDDVTVSLNAAEQVANFEVSTSRLSEYAHIAYGDYQLSVHQQEQVLMQNVLVTLNQGQSKTLLLYRDPQQNVASVALQETGLPQLYEHDVHAVNLSDEYDAVDLYFVRQDETVETAEFKLTGLDRGESAHIRLPDDYYELVAVYENSSDESILLYRSTLLGINEESLYLATIEKDPLTSSGVSVKLQK